MKNREQNIRIYWKESGKKHKIEVLWRVRVTTKARTLTVRTNGTTIGMAAKSTVMGIKPRPMNMESTESMIANWRRTLRPDSAQ